MVEYFDLIKGGTPKAVSNQRKDKVEKSRTPVKELTFGDLLRECRAAAKLEEQEEYPGIEDFLGSWKRGGIQSRGGFYSFTDNMADAWMAYIAEMELQYDEEETIDKLLQSVKEEPYRSQLIQLKKELDSEVVDETEKGDIKRTLRCGECGLKREVLGSLSGKKETIQYCADCKKQTTHDILESKVDETADIKAMYATADLPAPDGKGIHTKAFHELVINVAKGYVKSGDTPKEALNKAYPTAMKQLGKEKAVKKPHQSEKVDETSATKIAQELFSKQLGELTVEEKAEVKQVMADQKLKSNLPASPGGKVDERDAELEATEESKVTEQHTMFTCSKCGKEFEVRIEQEAICPYCGHIEEPSRTGPDESKLSEQTTSFECSRCGKEFEAHGEKGAKCPQCGNQEEPPTEPIPVPRKSESKVDEEHEHPSDSIFHGDKVKVLRGGHKGEVGKVVDIMTPGEEGTEDLSGQFDVELPDGKMIYLGWNDVELVERVGSKQVNELDYDDPDSAKRPEKARTRKDLLKKKPKKKRVEPEELPPVEEVPKKEVSPKEEVPKPEVSRDGLPPEPEEEEELDSDKIPPPPEEVKADTPPIEMRKEYLGRSEDVHYYFLTVEGDGGEIEDFVITDQEGIKKYSAKEKEIEVSEESIGDFLIKVYRDVEINQIERSIYMKYIYPVLAQLAPKEEELFEPEEEGKAKEDLHPQEEEEPPRESKKLNASVDKEDILAAVKDAIRMHTRSEYPQHSGGLDSDIEKKVLKWYEEGADLNHILVALGIPVEVDPITLDWPWLKDQGVSADVDPTTFDWSSQRKAQEKVKEVKESYLFELKITDDEENSFDVQVLDDGTEDTVMSIGEREFRFSPEFTSMWKDDVTGELTEEGVKEIALLKLADLEEKEYNELLGKTATAEADQDIDIEKSENENSERDSNMNKLSEFTDEQLTAELAARKEKVEGINPKKEDSEEKKIQKLAEEEVEVKEEKIVETDVAKGAKALITLAKEALKAGNYTEAAEHCAKLAEIEAVIPPEAEEEAKKETPKDDKTSDKSKDDKSKDDKPAEDLPSEEDFEFEAKEVAEAKDKAKAKKEKEDKAKKDKKEKEDKAKKDKEAKAKKEKDDKAKAAKAKAAKKESKIGVESTQDINETKGLERLKDLLNMEPIS